VLYDCIEHIILIIRKMFFDPAARRSAVEKAVPHRLRRDGGRVRTGATGPVLPFRRCPGSVPP
jgi:hypothetical protein